MRLPGKLIQEIIGHPDVRFSGSGSKRALGRVSVDAAATAFPLRNNLLEEPFEVSIRDISAETVGLTSHYAMMPGSSLAICMSRAGLEPVTIQCVVTRCNRVGDGEFAIGARFVGILNFQKCPLPRPDGDGRENRWIGEI